MKSQCPHCKQYYEIDNQYEGQKIECPACKNEFLLIPSNNEQENNLSQKKNCFEGSQKNKKNYASVLIVSMIVVCIVLSAAIIYIFVQNITLKKKIALLTNQLVSSRTEMKSCQQTIDDLRFGPERLKAEAEVALKEGDLVKAKRIFENLFSRHPHKKNDPLYQHSYNIILQQIIEKENRIAKQKEQQETLLLKYITKKYDHMQSITWYETKRNCKYVTKMGYYKDPDEFYTVELYAGRKDKGGKMLRLRTQYYIYSDSRTWIFYEKIQIKGSNGRNVYITTKYPEKKSESGNGSISEWADNNVTDISEDLTKIAASDVIFVKFYGKYPFEFKMTTEQKEAFKEIIARYNSLSLF